MGRLAVAAPALLVVLVLGACHAAAPADRGPRPLAVTGPRPAYVVAQASVDRAVPVGVDAYEGAQVTWDGTEPVAVILERFVRGKCFLRERLTAGPNGRFDLTSIPARGAATGGPARPGLVLLASILDGPAGRGQGTLQRDPLGRVAWVYALGPAEGKDAHRPEVVTQLRYDVHGCVLPLVLDRGAIPPKVRPAGMAPTPGSK